MPNYTRSKQVLTACIKIIFFCIILLGIYSFMLPDKTLKLFIHATFEDSVKLQSGDTNYIKGPICIKLRIDTIDMANLIKDKSEKMAPQPNNWYIYKGKYMLIHPKDQLFELNEYYMLRNFEIIEFDMFKIGSWDQSSTSTSNCFTDKQKKVIKDCWKALRNQSKEDKNDFLICRMKVYNKSAQRQLDFSGITFSINKH